MRGNSKIKFQNCKIEKTYVCSTTILAMVMTANVNTSKRRARSRSSLKIISTVMLLRAPPKKHSTHKSSSKVIPNASNAWLPLLTTCPSNKTRSTRKDQIGSAAKSRRKHTPRTKQRKMSSSSMPSKIRDSHKQML